MVELTIEQTKQPQKVTIMDWALFTLQQRPGNYSNHNIQADRLFHELLIDVYIQIEGDCFSYLRRNQHQIRSELYYGLQYALHETDHERPIFGNQVGITQQTICITSSFKKMRGLMHVLHAEHYFTLDESSFARYLRWLCLLLRSLVLVDH